MTKQLRAIDGKEIVFRKLSVSPVTIDRQIPEGGAPTIEKSGLKRCMQWLDGTTVWIYGQSILTRPSQRDGSASPMHLDQPIGDFLFSHPGVVIGELEYGVLPSDDALFQETVHACQTPPQQLIARRRYFYWQTSTLQVTEVFFDAFFNALSELSFDDAFVM